jgi:HD superfamily phosphodiesterase
MKKLTLSKAKSISKEYLSKIKDKDQRKFLMAHSKSVAQVCKLLGKNTQADISILEIASYVHDIGQSISQEDHAEQTIKILEKKFQINEKLKDCILNHGSIKNPLTTEGKIIQAADKISILDRKIIGIFLKNINKNVTEENTKMLRKITIQAMDFLEEYNKNTSN